MNSTGRPSFSLLFAPRFLAAPCTCMQARLPSFKSVGGLSVWSRQPPSCGLVAELNRWSKSAHTKPQNGRFIKTLVYLPDTPRVVLRRAWPLVLPAHTGAVGSIIGSIDVCIDLPAGLPVDLPVRSPAGLSSNLPAGWRIGQPTNGRIDQFNNACNGFSDKKSIQRCTVICVRPYDIRSGMVLSELLSGLGRYRRVVTSIDGQVELLIDRQDVNSTSLRSKVCNVSFVGLRINRRVSQPVNLRNARRAACPNVGQVSS